MHGQTSRHIGKSPVHQRAVKGRVNEGGEEEGETGLSGGLRERPKEDTWSTLLVAFLVTMQEYPLDTHERDLFTLGFRVRS